MFTCNEFLKSECKGRHANSDDYSDFDSAVFLSLLAVANIIFAFPRICFFVGIVVGYIVKPSFRPCRS